MQDRLGGFGEKDEEEGEEEIDGTKGKTTNLPRTPIHTETKRIFHTPFQKLTPRDGGGRSETREFERLIIINTTYRRERAKNGFSHHLLQ